MVCIGGVFWQRLTRSQVEFMSIGREMASIWYEFLRILAHGHHTRMPAQVALGCGHHLAVVCPFGMEISMDVAV